MLWKKLTVFWPGWNAENGLILHICRLLDMLIPMAQVSRLYIQMFLTYEIYVCIILETAHHRATFGIFCNITQNPTPEDNSQKIFLIASPIYIGHILGLISGNCATLLKILHLRTIARKCSIFFTFCTIFLWKVQEHFLE